MVVSCKIVFATAALFFVRHVSAFLSGPTTLRTPHMNKATSLMFHHDHRHHASSSLSTLYMSGDEEERPDYSRDLRLREEAESPFRKVRFFVYASLAGGAATSLILSLARIAAALSGVNADLLDESLTNAAVDIGGLVVLSFLFQRDVDAQDSRLKRAAKGAELAQLLIRGSNTLLVDSDKDDATSAAATAASSSTFTTTLSALRRGRGIEKRVVIVAASNDKIQEIIREAIVLQDSLTANDLVVVPVVLPQGIAPIVGGGVDIPNCVALPVGANWKTVVDDETREARKQGIDVEAEGISIVVKKNGRVGQRTRGVFLGRMVGEVVERRESGMDVSNI